MLPMQLFVAASNAAAVTRLLINGLIWMTMDDYSGAPSTGRRDAIPGRPGGDMSHCTSCAARCCNLCSVLAYGDAGLALVAAV